jgi:hypothetical protein
MVTPWLIYVIYIKRIARTPDKYPAKGICRGSSEYSRLEWPDHPRAAVTENRVVEYLVLKLFVNLYKFETRTWLPTKWIRFFLVPAYELQSME